ncbi:COPII subunit, partial [Mortierella sp. GBA43]
MFFYLPFRAAKPENELNFAREPTESLSQRIALEAMMRVLASKGRRMSAFYGNCFVQSTDLLPLPNVPRDKSTPSKSALKSASPCQWPALLHTYSSAWHELKLDDARDTLTNRRVEIMGVYNTHLTAATSGAASNLQIPDNLWSLACLNIKVARGHT